MFFIELLSFLHASFWTYFGRHEYHGEIWQYAIYLFLELAAIWGVFEIWRRSQHDVDFQHPAFHRSAFSLLFFTGMLAIVEILITLMKIRSPQGRYFYMAIVPIAITLGAGLIKILPSHWRLRGAIGGSIFLFVFQAYMFFNYWLPNT